MSTACTARTLLGKSRLIPSPVLALDVVHHNPHPQLLMYFVTLCFLLLCVYYYLLLLLFTIFVFISYSVFITIIIITLCFLRYMVKLIQVEIQLIMTASRRPTFAVSLKLSETSSHALLLTNPYVIWATARH